MDSEGGPAAALASVGTSGSHSVGAPLTAKHKTFAPHIPRNRDNKRRRMRGAVPSPGPADKSNHKFQNDAANHSNHKPQSNDPNGCNSTKPKESHETVPYSEITAGIKNKHWNDHNSTNPKESHEVASPSERAAKKRSYTWHRGETVQDTVEEDNTVIEGHIHSKLDTFSRPQDVPSNGRHFNGPSRSFYSHSQDQDIQSQRDSCYKLWNKLEATYDARERHVYKKEEELAKREQAIRTQEEIVAHWRTQAKAERLEAAYMRQEAYAERLRLEEETKRLEKLKADIEQIRDGIFSRQMANELSKDVLTNPDGGQNFHVKMELPQIDYHDDERISGQSGDGTSKVAVQSMQCGVEMPQNYLNTLENKGDESLEAMGDPSQCCVDTSQVKLDISAKAYEHSVGTMESSEVSVSEVSGSNVSEKRHFSQQRCSNGFSKEIVNRSLESPGFCAADIAVMGNSDPLPSEPTIVDACQGSLSFLTSVGDKEPMPQLSSQSKDGSRLNDVPAFQSSLHAETLICKETELNLNNTESSMATPKISAIPVQVKVENIEHEQHPSFIPNSDCKSDFFEDCTSDELDHVSLEERKKLCTETFFNMDVETKWLRADSSQAGESDSGEAWKEKARNFTLKRNKRKTKICSVETALEEDAPGLLQVLREKGVMEEIKLYGDFIDEDLLGLANEEDSFKDLESIIEKLWGRPSGLLKVVRPRQTTNKPNYCLSCLLSLIEQTRSLQNRKWPVEWGWCRQLQSFVFVFERHNRIVLERPEYGYATYFFELVQSLPIKWQVGRLITVMSIATCGRTALLENKPLEIGQDLNAEEASILEDYGWTPNSGLASLLNYCNRVVHDRKVDDDDMEWRSKIGKLLMDGHAGGRIAKANIPKKLQSFISVIKFEESQ